MTMAKLFSNAAQAANYSLHRPTYPQELYKQILDVCEGRSLAIDVATGSGQAATALADRFEKVVAQDGSREQLQHAARLPNVEYQLADAHSTGLPDNCADLITVAQALHWFDIPKFYLEARRVLKPTGTLAAWTYTLPILIHESHPAQAVLVHFYRDTLGPYWSERRHLVEVGYRGVEPSGDDFSLFTRRELETSKRQRLEDLIGYLRSWSAYQTYLSSNPDLPDPLVEVGQKLLEALGARDGGAELDVIVPLSLIIAKGPKALR